ncbi:MAG TPA: serine hydrolase domain-containing protein, partial [Gammaproteobacteria bacterium]|nr:serine hydrolase domain-containing protein [Gammaproteobacteria bacterium]
MSFERDQKTQSTRPESLSDLALEQLIKEAHVPGVAVASIIDGKPAWSTAAGFADKESKTLASADTPFWACSLSKPVFSYLILKLIEANQSGKATGVGKFKLPEGLEKF